MLISKKMIRLLKIILYFSFVVIISGMAIPVVSKILEMAGVSDELWSVLQLVEVREH